MKSIKWMAALGAALLALASMTAFAKDKEQGKGQGQGQGKSKGKSEAAVRYSDHDRQALRSWYSGRHGNLPPGLAKKDELTPGLEKQLVRNGTLPPGLQKKMYVCPPEVVRLLPPPPPDSGHFFIGGHVVLVNRNTFLVLDIFRF